MANVLIIDDEKPIRSVLKHYLQIGGHTVMEADNGSDGIKMVQNNDLDIIIADIVMPEKGGLEVLMELNDKPEELKIILMTGKISVSGDAINDLADRFGAVRLLEKPFSQENLLKLVNSLTTHT